MICYLQRVSLFFVSLFTLPFSLCFLSLAQLFFCLHLSTHFSQVAIKMCHLCRGGREVSLRSRQGSLMFSFVADQMRVQHALPARRYTAKEALGRQTDGHNVSINLAKKTQRKKGKQKAYLGTCMWTQDTLLKLQLSLFLQ